MEWRQGQPYLQDLRDRVLAAVDGGMAVRRVAPLFGVSVADIYKALIRRRLTGSAAPSANRGHKPRTLTPVQEAALRAHVAATPGITLAQAQAWLLEAQGVRLGTTATWKSIRRLGLSFKKTPARGRAGPPRRGGKADAVEGSPALHRPS